MKYEAIEQYRRYPYEKIFIQPLIIDRSRRNENPRHDDDSESYVVEYGPMAKVQIPTKEQGEWIYKKAIEYNVTNLEEIKKDYPNGKIIVQFGGPIIGGFGY